MTALSQQTIQPLPTHLLADATHNAYEPLHKLHAFCEAFCHLKAPQFKSFAQSFIELRMGPMHTFRWKEYKSTHKENEFFYGFTLGPWKGPGIVHLSRPLMCYLLDASLGGDVSAQVVLEHSHKAVTWLEQKRAEQFCHTLLKEAQATLQEHHSTLQVTAQKAVLTLHDMDQIGEQEKILVLEGIVNIDYHESSLELVLPYRSLDPIYHDLKPHHVCHTLTDVPLLWKSHLAHHAQESTVCIEALLYQNTHALHDILKWTVGTVLPLNIPRTKPLITLQCQGAKVGQGLAQRHEASLRIIVDQVPEKNP